MSIKWKDCEWCGFPMVGIYDYDPDYKPLTEDARIAPIRTVCQDCKEESEKA